MDETLHLCDTNSEALSVGTHVIVKCIGPCRPHVVLSAAGLSTYLQVVFAMHGEPVAEDVARHHHVRLDAVDR